MKCSTPPPLSDEEISAALEGAFDARTQQHLDNCAYCSARFLAAQEFERGLSKQLYRLNCPSSDALGDYVVGFLDDRRREAIAEHLRTCNLCQEEISHLEAFLNSQELSRRPTTTKPVGSPQRRLILPLRLQPASPAATLRSGARGKQEKKELVAEASGITLFLELHYEDTGIRLTGQLIAKDSVLWSGALLELWWGGQIQAAVILQTDGEFSCENIPPGEYELCVTGSDGQQLLLEILSI